VSQEERKVNVVPDHLIPLFPYTPDRSYRGDRFHIPSPQVVLGDIASGDQFFSAEEDVLALGSALPSVKCVEMEGAAVAQVCFEYGVPFTVIRTISDAANEDAPTNFMAFIQEVASLYAHDIIKNLFDLMVEEDERVESGR
jgi:adenosylhomocysteine nucleosidase